MKALELGHISKSEDVNVDVGLSSLVAASAFIWARNVPPNEVLPKTFSENLGRCVASRAGAGVS